MLQQNVRLWSSYGASEFGEVSLKEPWLDMESNKDLK
jgi:hypothetical protein